MSRITLKKLSEKYGGKWGSEKLTRFTKMLEMEGIPEDIDMPEPEEEVDADAALTDALKTLGNALIEQCVAEKMTPEDAGAKLTAYLQTHMGKAPEPEEEVEEDEEEDEPKKESVQTPKKKVSPKSKSKPTIDPIREALAITTKISFRAEESELEIIAASPVEKRETVAKRLKLVSEGVAGSPRSAGRDGLSTPAPDKTIAPKANEVKALSDW